MRCFGCARNRNSAPGSTGALHHGHTAGSSSSAASPYCESSFMKLDDAVLSGVPTEESSSSSKTAASRADEVACEELEIMSLDSGIGGGCLNSGLGLDARA